MNFNGLFHKFSKEDSRPKYVSFRYRVSKTQPVRGFFNVFLSSATEPYEDVDVFHLGRPRSLLDMSCLISTDGSGDIEVWLPTGERAHLSRQFTSREEAEDETNKNDWRKVEIHFNWDAVKVFSVINQGTTRGTADGPLGIPCAPQCWFRLDGKFVMNTRNATLVRLVVQFVGVATENLVSSPDADPKVLVALYRRDRTLVGRPLTLSLVTTLTSTQRVNVVRLGKWAFLMFSIKCSERHSVVVRLSS